MNPLHFLPPETAHNLGLWALRHGMGPRGGKDPESLKKDVFGKKFQNPIGLSAGADKAAEALAGWAKMGFGFVEAGTVTVHPREGNPKPRIWRLGRGQVVNWLGLPGDGIGPFVQNLKAFQDNPAREKLRLGVSFASPDGKTDEFKPLAAVCREYVDYMAINASCPNVEGHGSDYKDAIRDIAGQIDAVKIEAPDIPVMVKISPTADMDALGIMARALLDAGAAGFIATNTVPFAQKNLLENADFQWPQHNGQYVGGYSGPALLKISTNMIRTLRDVCGVDVPLIGVGGIQNAADAKAMLDAGADLLQIYTGLIYKGDHLLKEIKLALA